MISVNPRVLLINPPSPFLIEERVFAPTGVLYAAAELRSKGVPVEVLDLARRPRASDQQQHYTALVSDYEREYLDQVRDAARDFSFIGVSATTPQFKFAVKILDAIRDANPDARTVIGGAHPTLVSGLRNRMIARLVQEDPSFKSRPMDLEAVLDDFDPNFASVARFDHVVAGGAGGIFEIFRGSAPKWITSEKLGKNIDAIPIPARDLIDLHSYNYTLKNPRTGEVVRTTNVMSQWGCPFPCNFCSGRDDDFYRTVRKVSPAATVRELDHIHDTYGIKGFMFFDDELNIDNPRFRELLVLLKRRHEERGYVYRGFVKSELITERYPDTYKLMIDAGFAEACTGVESGSERILKEVIRKNTSVEINLKSARLAHEAGISFKAFTMIGHPMETEADALETYQWILNARPTGFDVTVHQPYPGAPVYDFAVKDPKSEVYFLTQREVDVGRKRMFTRGSDIRDAVFFFRKLDFADQDSDSFYKGKPGDYTSNVWTPALSAERIVELRDFIELEAKKKLGVGSVSGISYDGVMGQSAGARISGN
jgi:hypothetical protein